MCKSQMKKKPPVGQAAEVTGKEIKAELFFDYFEGLFFAIGNQLDYV